VTPTTSIAEVDTQGATVPVPPPPVARKGVKFVAPPVTPNPQPPTPFKANPNSVNTPAIKRPAFLFPVTPGSKPPQFSPANTVKYTHTPTPAPSRITFFTTPVREKFQNGDDVVVEDFADGGERGAVDGRQEPVRRKRRRWDLSHDDVDTDIQLDTDAGMSESPSLGSLPPHQLHEDENEWPEPVPSPTLSRNLRNLPFTPTLPPEVDGDSSAATVAANERLRVLRAVAATEEESMNSGMFNWSPTKKRRGEGIYIADGLAAVVAGWVRELRNAQGGRERVGELLVGRMRAEKGYLAVFEDGDGDGDSGRGMVLIGGEEARARVLVGSKVRIEWPWWEVDVEGMMWKMGVFWSVVGDQQQSMRFN
jgi:hypothetical protein